MMSGVETKSRAFVLSNLPLAFIQLAGKFGILRQLSDGALPGIDIGQQLIGVGDGGVQVLVEGVILEELACGSLAILQPGSDGVEVLHHGIRVVVECVVGHQFADRSLAIADVIHQSLELPHSRVESVVKRRVVNHLADRAVAAFDERHDAVDTPQQHIQVLQRALAGAYHVLEIRALVDLQRVTVLYRRALRVGAVNINKRFTEHTGGGQTRHGILPEIEIVFGSDPQEDFDGRFGIRGMGRNANRLHVPDVHPLQTNGCPHAQPTCIIEVSL